MTTAITATPLRWLAALPARARAWQAATLIALEALDAAVIRNMAHPAHPEMPVADPLVDVLYEQLEAPAAEGAQRASTADAGLTEQQRTLLADAGSDPALSRLVLLGITAGAVVSYFYPMGWFAL